MQMRILDHAKLLAAMNLPQHHRGSAVVEVRETEGFASKFRIDIEAGKAICKSTQASPDVVCPDRIWAAIVLGDLPIDKAAQLELVQVHRPAALQALSAFCDGPVPFCNDGF
jgi:hypothetical protein